MALYLIGDVHGCDDTLQQLLAQIDFSPSRDCIYLLGDLVNRGPASAAVLRRLMSYGGSAQCVLGNHDLHLLALAFGASDLKRKPALDDVLQAADGAAMLDWLRQQRLALALQHQGADYLLLHAGVLPGWSAAQAVALAQEVEQMLMSADLAAFLPQMYGNTPNAWSDTLRGAPRLRVIINALTRLRFCSLDGEMEFSSNGDMDAAPNGYLPWFELPQRQTRGVCLAFGHWAALGGINRPNLLGLDTGCVWGGCLSAVRLGAHASREWIQVERMATL